MQQGTIAWNKHDGEALCTGYTDESILVHPRGTFKGKAAIRKFNEDVWAAYPDSQVESVTVDAIRTIDRGASETYSGRKAIEKNFADTFAANPQPVVSKLLQVYSIEDRIVAISEYNLPGFSRGHTVKIYVRDADTWKVRWEFAGTTHSPQ
jgi:hypothetical protein